MLRLQSIGRVRSVIVYRTRSVTARSHSTHSQDHRHSHSHPHKPQANTSTEPVHAPSPLDPTVSGSASETCKNLVLKRDYESFLASKFYPTDAQDGLFALKAFYVYTIPSLSPRTQLTPRFVVTSWLVLDRVGNHSRSRHAAHYWANEDAILERCREIHWNGIPA